MADVNRSTIDLLQVAPVISGEDPATDIKAVAERVDRVLSSLQNQMKNFEAADSSTLGGVPASSVISGANAMYYQTFEDDVENDWYLRSGSIAAISYSSNGKAGGRALRTTLKSVWLTSNVNVPFDPDRLYRIRTRVRKIAGVTNFLSVGVEGVGADGLTVVDRNGGTTTGVLQNLVAKQGNESSVVWVTYTGYFKGVAGTGTASTPSTDASAPRVLHEDTRYIRPFLSLSQTGDTGTYEIDYITLEVLTETLESNELVSKVGGRNVSEVASTVKSGGGVADDQVGNDAVLDGVLLTGKMGTLIGGGLTIDWTAAGASHVLDHASFYLTAAGDAVFAGTVSASSFTAATATFTGAMNIEVNGGETLVAIYNGGTAGGIRLNTSVASKSHWRMANDSGNNLTFEQPAGDDYHGYVGFVDAHVKSAHAIFSYGILTNDLNSTLLDIFDTDGHPYHIVKTNNSAPTTFARMSTHSDMVAGQHVFVWVDDANTTFDFSTGTYYSGNGGSDYSPASGEIMLFLCTANNHWRWVNNP